MSPDVGDAADQRLERRLVDRSRGDRDRRGLGLLGPVFIREVYGQVVDGTAWAG
jgi:hypothetical protein